MTTETKLNNYLTAYFQAAFKYLQSGDCQETVGRAIAALLYWLVSYIIIPTGALLLYCVVFTFTFIKNKYNPDIIIAPHSETEVNTEEDKEEGQKIEGEDIRVKRVTSYEIEYSPRTKEVHVDRNREADFGEGYFTNLEEADEEAPF